MLKKFLALRALKGGTGGGSGGSGGVVVCEEAEVTKATTINQLKGVRLSLPNATSIGVEAFTSCTALTSVDLPAATYIAENAFTSCTALTSVDLPVATSINTGAFYGCTALTSVDLPVATSIEDGVFAGCTALTSVDLPAATSIGGYAFQDCTNLSNIILRTTSTVCSVDVTAVLGTKIMTNQGIPTGEGFVYIPAAMFEYYRAAYEPAFEQMGAAGVFDLLFRKIEDYPEICG